MKVNAKVMMVEVIEGLAKEIEGSVYIIPENKVVELQQVVEASEKFAVLEKDGKCYIVYKSKMRPSGAIAEYKVAKVRKANVEAAKATAETKAKRTPDNMMTGEQVRTPRGVFAITAMSRKQMEAAGYGYHHQSDDGKYLIMGNGKYAFAILAEQPKAKEAEGLMGLTIAELRQKSKELGLPYMHKHRALNKATLAANIEAAAATV